MERKAAIFLAYTERTETAPGVFENSETLLKVKADQEQVYQRRLEKAMADGLIVTARFKVRSELIPQTGLNYVQYQGDKYKINFVQPQKNEHYTIIELGGLV